MGMGVGGVGSRRPLQLASRAGYPLSCDEHVGRVGQRSIERLIVRLSWEEAAPRSTGEVVAGPRCLRKAVEVVGQLDYRCLPLATPLRAWHGVRINRTCQREARKLMTSFLSDKKT
jgi:hypothetical protein